MSPFEIEILLHYYYSVDDHPRLGEPVVLEKCKEFFDLGLLKVETYEGEEPRFQGNREALDVYCGALCAVLLPVKTWAIMPDVPPLGEEIKSSSSTPAYHTSDWP